MEDRDELVEVFGAVLRRATGPIRVKPPSLPLIHVPAAIENLATAKPAFSERGETS